MLDVKKKNYKNISRHIITEENIKEIRDLLPKNLEIYSTYGSKVKSPAENGKTFEENSLIKARYFSEKLKMICLSDDSGLEIDIIGEAIQEFILLDGVEKKADFIKAMNRVFKELDKIRKKLEKQKN